jgi:anti-anti-sigma factor
MTVLPVKNLAPPQRPLHTAPDPVVIEIEQIGDVCVLHFKGRLHAGHAPEYLSAKMEQIKALACTKVLADLEHVPSAGSSGLSFIIGLYRISSGRLVLARTQRRVQEVLDITGLSTVIPLVPDIDSGLAALLSPLAVLRARSQA